MSGRVEIVLKNTAGTTDITNWDSLNPKTRDVYQSEVNIKKYDSPDKFKVKKVTHLFFADDDGVVRQVQTPDSISVRFENGRTLSLDQYFYIKPLIGAFRSYDQWPIMETPNNKAVTKRIQTIFEMFELDAKNAVVLLNALQNLNLDNIPNDTIQGFKDLIFSNVEE